MVRAQIWGSYQKKAASRMLSLWFENWLKVTGSWKSFANMLEHCDEICASQHGFNLYKVSHDAFWKVDIISSCWSSTSILSLNERGSWLKNENSVIIYSLSCCSKPDFLSAAKHKRRSIKEYHLDQFSSMAVTFSSVPKYFFFMGAKYIHAI